MGLAVSQKVKEDKGNSSHCFSKSAPFAYRLNSFQSET